MKNTQKGFITAAAIVLGVLILGGGAYYYSRTQAPLEEEVSNVDVKNEGDVSDSTNDVVSEKGITVTSPTPNELVKFPITVSGSVNGNGWLANESEAGVVEVFDANGKSISNKEILKATTDWLILPTQFSAMVGDREMMAYIQTDTGIVRIKNQGAKDGDATQTVEIPVRFR